MLEFKSKTHRTRCSIKIKAGTGSIENIEQMLGLKNDDKVENIFVNIFQKLIELESNGVGSSKFEVTRDRKQYFAEGRWW